MVKSHAVVFALGGNFCCPWLTRVLLIRAIADNSDETGPTQCRNVAWLNLPGNGAHLRQFVDRHRKKLDGVNGNLEIPDLVFLRLGQVASPDIHLNRRQQKLRHPELAVSAFSHFHKFRL